MNTEISFMTKSVYSSLIFLWFSSIHGILGKIYLNVGWWQAQISYFCHIISWSISHSHLDIGNVIKYLNICFILKNQKLQVKG